MRPRPNSQLRLKSVSYNGTTLKHEEPNYYDSREQASSANSGRCLNLTAGEVTRLKVPDGRPQKWRKPPGSTDEETVDQQFNMAVPHQKRDTPRHSKSIADERFFGEAGCTQATYDAQIRVERSQMAAFYPKTCHQLINRCVDRLSSSERVSHRGRISRDQGSRNG
jgi:hypothetical protein